jgi:protein-L-isoaspartate(D-aspartate) O-methyltransferase
MTLSDSMLTDQRRRMVERTIAGRGIRARRVLQAMLEVPRDLFVPSNLAAFAYEDTPLGIGEGQTISQPYIVALMCEAMEIASTDRVLEVGTGSGYAAAVLSGLATEVQSLERHPPLARAAGRRLKALGYDNVHVHCGDGTLGWPERAPYDAIAVAAGASSIPQPLLWQLSEGGRLVIPIGDESSQTLIRIRRERGTFVSQDLGGVRFVPLIGGPRPDSPA